MKRPLFLMILSLSAISRGNAQEPAKVDPKHYRVPPAEAPNHSVTPDGRYRLYEEDNWEGDHLFLRDLRTGESRCLTKGRGDAADEIMSPGGRLIAYAWVAQDGLIELRIVGIDSSEPRVVYSNRNVALLLVHEWSPDGKYLAATVFQKDRTSQLVLVSVADGSVRVLKTQVLKTLNWSYQRNRMSFSLDGRFVAYDQNPQGVPPRHLCHSSRGRSRNSAGSTPGK
jgi:Tol biopolymer transport system component